MSKIKNTEAVPPKFEAAVAELEKIVHTMESGELALEESLAAYQRGVLLLRHCQQQLDDAERRLQVLDGETLRPFDADAAAP